MIANRWLRQDVLRVEVHGIFRGHRWLGVLMLALASFASGQDVGEEISVRDEALLLLHKSGDAWPEVPALHKELVALGPEVAPTLFATLVIGEVAKVEELERRPLDAPREHAIVASLEALPRSTILSLLERSAAAPLAERIQAVRLLARFGTVRELRLIERLGSPRHKGRSTELELCREVESALARILKRDEATASALARLLPEFDPALYRPAARSIGALENETAMRALTLALNRSQALDSVILLEIRYLASKLSRPTGLLAAERVSGTLDCNDPTVRALAAAALEALDARSTIPDLIPLLDDRKPIVRAAAHQALRSLAAQKIGPDSLAWSLWYEAEAEWYWAERPALVDALERATGDAAARAIRELAAHRIYHDALANDLIPVLKSSNSQLVVLACGALAHLGSWSAVDPLVLRMESEDVVIRSAVHAALSSITKMELPAVAAHWRIRIEHLKENG